MGSNVRHHTGMTMGLTSHHVLSNGPLSYLQQPDSQSSEGFQSRRCQQKPREETRLRLLWESLMWRRQGVLDMALRVCKHMQAGSGDRLVPGARDE